MTLRRFLIAAALLGALTAAATASASSRWRAVRNVSGGEERCIQVQDNRRDYTVLIDGEAAVVHVRGPRRLRVLHRVLPADPDAADVEYSLRLYLDGSEVDLKRHVVDPVAGVHPCDDPDAPAGALRKAYVRIPDGMHEVMIQAGAAAGDRVALRVFQESVRRRTEDVSLSPETYEDVLTLQFESGSHSTYYAFSNAKPLTFRVTGPTTVELWTRLDFEHTMSGRQHYVLDVLVDGVSTGLRHYDVGKLEAAAYVQRSDVLPGHRKKLRLRLDKGRHRVEVRCVRPENCCVAAKIWLPAEDLR